MGSRSSTSMNATWFGTSSFSRSSRRTKRLRTATVLMPSRGSYDRRLRVLIADEEGRRVSGPGVSRWLVRVAPRRARGEVGVALVSNARVRALNRRYRRRDYATDVLSFSYGAWGRANPQSLTPNPYLGDIVIATGVARRQAKKAGHSELTE